MKPGQDFFLDYVDWYYGDKCEFTALEIIRRFCQYCQTRFQAVKSKLFLDLDNDSLLVFYVIVRLHGSPVYATTLTFTNQKIDFACRKSIPPWPQELESIPTSMDKCKWTAVLRDYQTHNSRPNEARTRRQKHIIESRKHGKRGRRHFKDLSIARCII